MAQRIREASAHREADSLNRRCLLARSVEMAAAAAAIPVLGRTAVAAQPPADHPYTLTVVEGPPRRRGQMYGSVFAQAIREFLQREIYTPFAKDDAARDSLLRYAGACAKQIADYSPEVAEELTGIAEAAGIRLEEAVLLTLHEELYHRGAVPAGHCTAIAAGPPHTRDGATYVAMTWDWMVGVFGLSSMVLWRRSRGPSVLGYAYPGLWVGAGVNSAGIALCWTSASLGENIDGPGPRVGIPSYVLIAHLLYQESLDQAVAEARRARQAGWFTFVLADGRGELASIEGSPKRLAVERSRGRLARAYYGTREMTHTPGGRPVAYHPRCQQAYSLLDSSEGKLDRRAVEKILATPPITNDGTIDRMIFNSSARKAFLNRGPRGAERWQEFSFE
jgi:isopenicillin-N N-acyltransferase-like protein